MNLYNKEVHDAIVLHVKNDQIEQAIDYIEKKELDIDTYTKILKTLLERYSINNDKAKFLDYFLNINDDFYKNYEKYTGNTPFIEYIYNDNIHDFLIKTFALKGEKLCEENSFKEYSETIHVTPLDYFEKNDIIIFSRYSTSNENILINLAEMKNYGFKYAFQLAKDVENVFKNDFKIVTNDIELYQLNRLYKSFKEKHEAYFELIRDRINDLNLLLPENNINTK